jgi:hypothetical protein
LTGTDVMKRIFKPKKGEITMNKGIGQSWSMHGQNKKNLHNILVKKSLGKRLPGRPGHN